MMLTSLVYFGEHWVIDGFVGWAIVGGVVLVLEPDGVSPASGAGRSSAPRSTGSAPPTVSSLPIPDRMRRSRRCSS